MLSFSQRKGLKPVRDQLQSDRMDDELCNRLWNALTFCYWDRADRDMISTSGVLNPGSYTPLFLRKLWNGFFALPVDTLDKFWSSNLKAIRKRFFEMAWNEVYDFIEFAANNYPSPNMNIVFMQMCNSVLATELSAYRFVAGTISQLTSEEEISAIEDALAGAKESEPFANHLKTALALLSDRKAPDYRNSIKESISAVEALCKLVAADPKASLEQALRQVQGKIPLHPSLRSALSKLYGYTSDADGIRHALLEEPTSTFEDAKFMLVTCSAFVNYLRAKALRAGIDL